MYTFTRNPRPAPTYAAVGMANLVSWSKQPVVALVIVAFIRLSLPLLVPSHFLHLLSSRRELNPPPRHPPSLLEQSLSIALHESPEHASLSPASPLLLSLFHVTNLRSQLALAFCSTSIDIISSTIMLSFDTSSYTPSLAFLVNPPAVLASLGGSPAPAEALAALSAILSAFHGHSFFAGSALALAASLSPHLIALAPALALLSAQHRTHSAPKIMKSSLLLILGLALSLIGILALCTLSLRSLGCTLRLTSAFAHEVFSVNDHSPDLGLHWYLSAQTLSRFRSVLHAAVHYVSIALIPSFIARTRAHEPFSLVVFSFGCAVLGRSHPSAADVGPWLSLHTLAPHITSRMRTPFVECTLYLFSLSFAFGAWEMWVENKTGNANHFFGASLVYCAFQVLVLCDFLNATLRYVDEHKKRLSTYSSLNQEKFHDE